MRAMTSATASTSRTSRTTRTTRTTTTSRMTTRMTSRARWGRCVETTREVRTRTTGASMTTTTKTSRVRTRTRRPGWTTSRARAAPTTREEEARGEGAASRRRRLTPKEALRLALADLDASGWWAVISSGIVFGTFLLETYNVSSLGGWDVLYREDIPWYTGIISMDSLTSIEDAYNLLFLFELALRAYAADFSFKFWTKPVTVVDVVSTVPPILAIVDVVDRTSPFYRFLRLLRVLRLLRLLDRDSDKVLFGLVKSDSMSVQLVGIGAEFICIFVIAAGVIYDLEYDVNPMVHNLNDTLYWAILTLTGIGQPFEVVTPGGRVATVISIIVALIVVPGQLAKLATVSGAQSLMEMMDEEEDEEEVEEEEVDGFVRITDETTLGENSKVFDDRECEQCGLTMHERDARFCRRCAHRLAPATTMETTTYARASRKKAKPRTKKPVDPMQLPGMRLGIDTTNVITQSMDEIRQSKNKNRR